MLLPDDRHQQQFRSSKPGDRKMKTRTLQISLFVIIAFVIILIYTAKSGCNSDLRAVIPLNGGDGRIRISLPALQMPHLSMAEYASMCFSKLAHNVSISHAFAKIKLMSESYNENCRNIYDTFTRIYDIQKIDGLLEMPREFQEEVRGWLNNDEALFRAMGHQEIYKVSNKVLGEASVFNLLRSKRPLSKPNIDPLTYIQQLINSTESSCDFCHYRSNTAEDVFGRIENKLSATASNAFKLAKFHGLFFPVLHEPVNIPLETLNDIFLKTVPMWYDKALKQDPDYTYPTMLWDMLPHAGASQVHPHIHGLLDKLQYSGQFETFRSAGNTYYRSYNKLLWNDIILVHWALGLAVTEGKAVAIVPITARKDHEFMILSDSLNQDAVTLVYRIIQAYQKHLGVYCFSAGASLPVLKTPDSGLPFIFRIGSRGDCTSVRSDVSSLELYTINNINTDAAVTLEALKTATN